ncbi:MAG: alpha/beta fold hydrolase [Janthinobacterium lividum]
MKYLTQPKWQLILLFLLMLGSYSANAQRQKTYTKKELSDEALIKSLPGFENQYVQVNGLKLHYVAGGKGQPLVLLPGWPQTWWSYHKVMPALAANYRVIVVDIRGMGTSDKPAAGYDKKTMAQDIYQLIRQLGYDKVTIAGHDIGSQLAFSFAANYPAATAKLVMMDVPHPDESYLNLRLLPANGTFGDKIDEAHSYPWWFAFHQVKGFPEQILLGRVQYEHEWFFKYLLYNEAAVNALDRAVYVAAYDSRDGIRAGDAWYQAFPQDVEDSKTYGKLLMPVLAIGGPGFDWMKASLVDKTTNLKMVKATGSGHFIPEEKPEDLVRLITEFIGQ